MGKKSTPKSPDYAGAAKEQAQSSREVTEQQSWGNRPDQVTPFGSTTWGNQMEWDPSTQQYLNKWTQNTEVNPRLQPALDSQFDVQNTRGTLGADVAKRMASGELSKDMDWDAIQPGMGARVGARDYGDSGTLRNRMEDNLYGRATSRLDPQWQSRGDDLRAQLYSMGAKEGDPAYDRAMQEFGRDRNDAYQQAQYGATAGGASEQANEIGMGGAIQGQQQQASAYDTQLRQQAIAEELQKRGTNLNEMNAIISGQQVGVPQMPTFNTNAASQGVQSLQAAQMQGQADLDRFNAKQQAVQGMMSGVGSIAGGMMS
jgi:hypothetical protein